MQKIIIIGGDSYIATGLDQKLSHMKVIHLFYHNWKENLNALKDADWIVNFSIDPCFSTGNMELKDILDIQVADAIKNYDVRYMFMSSRKVYGACDICKEYSEEDALFGVDYYAKNKIKTEQALRQILGDKLAIVRISNIIGEPVMRAGYKTFIGWICENYLTKGELTVNQNSNSIKDFITKDFLHDSIVSLISKNVTGIVNVSSGFGTPVKDVLKGYVGEANIRFSGENSQCTDQFILNNTKLKNISNMSITRENLLQYLMKCHEQLVLMKKAPFDRQRIQNSRE